MQPGKKAEQGLVGVGGRVGGLSLEEGPLLLQRQRGTGEPWPGSIPQPLVGSARTKRRCRASRKTWRRTTSRRARDHECWAGNAST